MFSRLATPLFAKVAAIVGGALLAAILILWLLLKAESARVEKWQSKAIAAEQSIKRQNEAIEALHAESVRKEALSAQARAEGIRAIERAKLEAEKLRNLPENGCPTPREILSADL